MKGLYEKPMKGFISVIALFLLCSLSFAQGGVEFVFPKDGMTVHEKFKIVLRKANPTGYIALWLDGQFLTAIGPPFEHEIDPDAMKLKDGEHELRAEARDGDGTYAGSATVKFRLARQAQLEVPPEGLMLSFKFRPGEVWFYTVKAESKAKVRIPKRARTEDLPFLEQRLMLQWNQMVRGIAPDRYYQVSREFEEGQIRFLAPPGTVPAGTVGVETPGSAMGGETGATTPGAQMFQVVSLPLQPMRRTMLASMKTNGSIYTNDYIESLLAFATAGVDIEFPDFPLKIGAAWKAPVAVRPELFLLSVIHKSEEHFSSRVEAPYLDLLTLERFELLGVEKTRSVFESGTKAVSGTIRGDVKHVFAGFEWQMDKPCAKIVTNYELDIKFEFFGRELRSVEEKKIEGQLVSRRVTRAPLARKEFKGSGKGTRIIYFDVKDGRVISSREEVELTFNVTDLQEFIKLLTAPQTQPSQGQPATQGSGHSESSGASQMQQKPGGTPQGLDQLVYKAPGQLIYTVRIDTTFDSARNRRDWIPAGLRELLRQQ